MNYGEFMRDETGQSYLTERNDAIYRDPPKTTYTVQEIANSKGMPQLATSAMLALDAECIKLFEENAKMDTALMMDSETITDQAKRIEWLEYMIAMAHFISSPKDIDLWKEQTAKIYEVVEDRLTCAGLIETLENGRTNLPGYPFTTSRISKFTGIF
jgi:hypothetical protein